MNHFHLAPQGFEAHSPAVVDVPDQPSPGVEAIQLRRAFEHRLRRAADGAGEEAPHGGVDRLHLRGEEGAPRRLFELGLRDLVELLLLGPLEDVHQHGDPADEIPFNFAFPVKAALQAVERVVARHRDLLVEECALLEVQSAKGPSQLQGERSSLGSSSLPCLLIVITSWGNSVTAQAAVPWVAATTWHSVLPILAACFQRGDLADEGLDVHAVALPVAAHDGGQQRPRRVSVPGASGASSCAEAALLGRRVSAASAGATTSTSTSTSLLGCHRDASAVGAAHGEARRLLRLVLALVGVPALYPVADPEDLGLRGHDALLVVGVVREGLGHVLQRRLVGRDLVLHLLQHVAHGLCEWDALGAHVLAARGLEAADHRLNLGHLAVHEVRDCLAFSWSVFVQLVQVRLHALALAVHVVDGLLDRGDLVVHHGDVGLHPLGGHLGNLLLHVGQGCTLHCQLVPKVHIHQHGLVVDLPTPQPLPLLGLVDGTHGRGKLLQVGMVEGLLPLEGSNAAVDDVRPLCRVEHAVLLDLDFLDRRRRHPCRRASRRWRRSRRRSPALAVRRRRSHRQPCPATAGGRCRRAPEASGGRQLRFWACHGRLPRGALREAPHLSILTHALCCLWSCYLLHSFWLIGVCQLRIESHWCWNVVNGSATMFNIKY